MGTGRAKGTVLVNLRGFVLRTHGPEVWERVVRCLPLADQTTLTGILVTGAWYPVGVWNRALDAYLPIYFPDPMAAMADLSSYIAQEDLTTLYKVLLKIGTPGIILGRTGSLWGRYFDTGVFRPKEVGPKRWQLELEGPVGEDDAPSAFTCEGACSWLVGGLRLSGIDLKVKQTHCRFRGSPKCIYDARW
jgi:hypothetical protein